MTPNETSDAENSTGPTWTKKVDNDWKRKIADEKAALNAKDQANGTEGGAGNSETSPIFLNFLQGIGAQALAALGELEDPMTGARRVDPGQAQGLIDLLGVLSDKTKGNLSNDEERLLSDLMTTLRMRFVETVRAANESAAAGPGAMPPPGPGSQP